MEAITESVQVFEVFDQAEETAFAGMADQEDQEVEEMMGQEEQQEQHENTEDSDHDSEPERHWWWLHYRRANRNISPIIEVQRLAWSNWFEQHHNTLFDHGIGNTDAELWIYMH